jgi:hypothetical protein
MTENRLVACAYRSVSIYSLRLRTAVVVAARPMTAAPVTTRMEDRMAPISNATKESSRNASEPKAIPERLASFLDVWNCAHKVEDFELEVEGEVGFGDFGVIVGAIGGSFFDVELEGSEWFVVCASGQFDGVKERFDVVLELGRDADGVGVQQVGNDLVGVFRSAEGVVVSGHV